MPETFIVSPIMTDEELIQGINKDTRFVILDDHTNTEPTGGPNTKDYLAGKEHLLDELIKQFSNCIFILDNYRFNVKDYNNMIWLPLDWICFCSLGQESNVNLSNWQTKRNYTANYTGGKNRINRILLEHWLAKHYPLDQLIYTKREDSDLGMIEDVINFSEFANKKHIKPRTNLTIKWQPDLPREIAGHSWITRRISLAKKLFIPNIKMQSYLALECEPQDINLNSCISGRTWESMMGGNLILQFGNYQVLEIYKKLGLQTFDKYFDNSHLVSTDRYYQTIGGCENNKELICDHDAIESIWYDNVSALQHNFILAKDINHWLDMFEQPMRILSDAMTLTTNKQEPTHCITVPVDRFRYEYKL